EGVADADVGGDRDREEACSSARRGVDGGSHVCRKARQKGIREVRMIEDVEDLGSQLNFQLLSDVRVFEDREVDVVITRTAQGIATKRTEMPGAGNARTGAAVARGIKRARHFEGRQVDKPIRRACARIRITDEIGSREKLAGVVVVVKQRQVKRIAGAYGYH